MLTPAVALISFLLTAAVQAAGEFQAHDQLPAAAASVDETQRVDVPEPSEKALHYHRTGNVLWVVDQVWALLILVVILATGFSARLRDWSQRIGRRWFFTLVVY